MLKTAFRFNQKDLLVSASETAGSFSKQGLLWFKEKCGSRFNKVDNFTERFVKLSGNLLFYFKGKDQFTECTGVLVLERYRIVETKFENIYGFIIDFEEAEEQYAFGTHNRDEYYSWLKILDNASYEILHEKMLSLRKELLELTGEDPLPDYHPQVINENENDKRISLFTTNLDVNSTFEDPVIELCISCSGLLYESETRPAAMVILYLMQPPSEKWFKHSNTEISEESSEPTFLRTIALSACVNPITRLKFVVYAVLSKSKSDVSPIGRAVTSIQEIRDSDNLKKSLSLVNMDKNVGTLTIQGWLRDDISEDCLLPELIEQNETFHNKYITKPVERSFHFPTSDGRDVKFQEILSESPYNFRVPKLLLDFFDEQEKACVIELHSIGKLHPTWEKIKEKVVRYFHFDLVSKYSKSNADLCLQDDLNFKKSIDKSKKELEFVPTNLHIHTMRVKESNGNEMFYDVVTVGAPSAHSMRFKSGGLKRNEEKKNNDGFGKEEKMKSEIKNAHLVKDELKRISNQLNTIAEKIEKFIPATDKFEEIREYASDLTEQIGELLELNYTDFVKKSASSLLTARTNGPELRLKSATISTNIDDPNYESLKWEWTGTEFKSVDKNVVVEEDCGTAEELGRFLQSVNVASTGNPQGLRERLESLSKCYKSLLAKLHTQMRFVIMQSNADNVRENADKRYRRDVVFTQTLTSVISGFMLTLSRRIHDSRYFEQLMNIGLLVHFESLLTTYGDEMGMLEDMRVGVTDINTVSFRLVCSDSQIYPRFTGSRKKMVAELPLGRDQFAQLPEQLRNGQTIRLYPLLFSIGINEAATLAERFGDTSLQEEINKGCCETLNSYYKAFTDRYPNYVGSRSSSAEPLRSLMENLVNLISLKKNKNYEVLTASAELCSRMSALRLTCCKSAKDRTAMSVTLEMARTLQREHRMRPDCLPKVLDTLRSQGVRLLNCYKNVGQPKYSFNYVQIIALPTVYRPPEGTTGKYLAT